MTESGRVAFAQRRDLSGESQAATAGQSIATDRYLVQGSTTYTNGTGAGAANKQWNDNRTLGGSSDSLDLAGGLTNRIGKAASFATVRLVYLRANADNAALT